MAFYLAYGRDLDTGGYRDLEGTITEIRAQATKKFASQTAVAIESKGKILGYVYETKMGQCIWISSDKKTCRYFNPLTGRLGKAPPRDHIAKMRRLVTWDQSKVKAELKKLKRRRS